MPDPISPTGSPGQLPVMAQTQASFVQVPGASAPESGRVASVGSEKPTPEPNLEDVSLEIAQKTSEKKSKQEDNPVPSLEDATKTLKEYLKNLPSDLQFTKDEETGTVMFKIINPLTKEVIREFPPEEVVEMTKRLRKMGQHSQKSGILFDANS